MSYFSKKSAAPGITPEITCRFIRLNYFYANRNALGSSLMLRPNILLVCIDGVWRKLHEGEVIDLGSVRTLSFSYDYFGEQFGGTSSDPDFEIEASDTYLADLRTGGPLLFMAGVSLTLANTATSVINTPPGLTASAKQGLNVYAPLRRVVIANDSGGTLLIYNHTGAASAEVRTGRRFEEEIRGEVIVGNLSGGSLTFYYETYFEWV